MGFTFIRMNDDPDMLTHLLSDVFVWVAFRRINWLRTAPYAVNIT